jgi:DNA-directed RNA polymerase subunit M/transcription elongation factor TFIIS
MSLNSKQLLLPLTGNDKKASQIEKLISGLSVELYPDDTSGDAYKTLLLEVMTDLRRGLAVQDCITNLKNKNVLWNHANFADILFKQREQDEFIVNPFEVEEGVLKCPKCSNMRTFSYSKQTRSADEPMTTFAQCMGCKHKWTYSG